MVFPDNESHYGVEFPRATFNQRSSGIGRYIPQLSCLSVRESQLFCTVPGVTEPWLPPVITHSLKAPFLPSRSHCLTTTLPGITFWLTTCTQILAFGETQAKTKPKQVCPQPPASAHLGIIRVACYRSPSGEYTLYSLPLTKLGICHGDYIFILYPRSSKICTWKKEAQSGSHDPEAGSFLLHP